MAKEGETIQLHSLSGNARALKEAIRSVTEMCVGRESSGIGIARRTRTGSFRVDTESQS
jgi:hypothetical protein